MAWWSLVAVLCDTLSTTTFSVTCGLSGTGMIFEGWETMVSQTQRVSKNKTVGFEKVFTVYAKYSRMSGGKT